MGHYFLDTQYVHLTMPAPNPRHTYLKMSYDLHKNFDIFPHSDAADWPYRSHDPSSCPVIGPEGPLGVGTVGPNANLGHKTSLLERRIW